MEGKYLAKYRKRSHWGSCRTITELLNENYQGFTSIDMEESNSFPEELKYLAITDHRWLSSSFLNKLKVFKDVQVDWYVFGDFTLKLTLFQEHLKVFQQQKLRVFVASESQKDLVLTIFPETKEWLTVKPYPIGQRFSLPLESTQDWRRKINLSNEEKLFGYVGRISPQKGIIELLQSFINNEKSLNGKLVLAGPVDAHPFWQFSDEVDSSFIPTFKKLLYLAGSQVTWLPWVEPSDLPGLYLAMDLFISPSYFHDEDYGLTASEARACGVKCLLSEWGGYKRFKADTDVRFIGLEETEMGFKINVPSLGEALLNFDNAPISHAKPDALTAGEAKEILNRPQFLNRDGKFDIEVYRKLYANYV